MQGVELMLGAVTQSLVTQVPVEVTTSKNIALSFSGSQGFLVLIAGILLAIAFQLLIANFFIALGISYSDAEDESSSDQEDSLDETITKVGTVVGLRTLGTISISLFTACFMATKLCLTHDPALGAILGILIWAAYFSLLLWLSLTTAGSIVGTVLNTATSGLQGIVGTAAVAIGAKNVTEQVASTAEAAATTVRRELSLAVDLESRRQAVADYLHKLRLPEIEHQELKSEFQRLVSDPEMQVIAQEHHLHNVGRNTLLDLVTSRTDFSKQDISQALGQFESFWQQVWGQPQQESKEKQNGLVGALSAAHPQQPQPAQLTPKLERLIEKTRKRQAQQQQEAQQQVAETAAWWLFGTAFTSAAASAIAGVVSVRG